MIVAKTTLIRIVPVMGKSGGIFFVDIHPAGEGSYPHIPDIVLIGGMDGVIDQAGPVDLIVLVMLQDIRSGIVNAQACILQSYPQVALIVLSPGIDGFARQAVAL